MSAAGADLTGAAHVRVESPHIRALTAKIWAERLTDSQDKAVLRR